MTRIKRELPRTGLAPATDNFLRTGKLHFYHGGKREFSGNCQEWWHFTLAKEKSLN